MPLPRLEYVPIQEIWKDENADLTPWIASEEGREVLGQQLGFKISDPRTQVNVGTFRADIVAERPDTQDVVVFENQFGDTDHSHLGQLLTYAAGLKAGVIIWVAERFREEHRSALRWLNENSKGLAFIGIELKAAKIAGSAVAPLPVVVVSPSEATSSAAEALKPWLSNGRNWHINGPDIWKENAALVQYAASRLERDGISVNWNLKLYVRAKGQSGRDVVLYDSTKKGRLDVVFMTGTEAEVENELKMAGVATRIEPEYPYMAEPWIGVESNAAFDEIYPAVTHWLKSAGAT